MKRIIKYLSPIFSIYKLNLYKIDPPIDSSMSTGVKCELEEISYDNYKLAYTIDKESKLDFKSMLKDGDSGVFTVVMQRRIMCLCVVLMAYRMKLYLLKILIA